jgi:hypothetical protein
MGMAVNGAGPLASARHGREGMVVGRDFEFVYLVVPIGASAQMRVAIDQAGRERSTGAGDLRGGAGAALRRRSVTCCVAANAFSPALPRNVASEDSGGVHAPTP